MASFIYDSSLVEVRYLVAGSDSVTFVEVLNPLRFILLVNATALPTKFYLCWVLVAKGRPLMTAIFILLRTAVLTGPRKGNYYVGLATRLFCANRYCMFAVFGRVFNGG